MGEEKPGPSRKFKLQISLTFLSLIPLVTTLFLGVGKSHPEIVALVTASGIAAAAFSLAWGTESLQFVISQVLALALLAIVQVLPEYSIEVVLASHGAYDPIQLHYATASMTGANRLLLGLGWPAVMLVSFTLLRKEGRASRSIQLLPEQGTEVLFLLISTLYSFVIVLKGTLTFTDASILISVFLVYLYVASKIPPLSKDKIEEIKGAAREISKLSVKNRFIAISSLIALGAFLTLAGSEPFVRSIIQVGGKLSLDQFLFIQWVAPILTEFPESMTALYWASRSGYARIALANLVSSKLNQWTLLLATIPITYDLTLSRFESIALTRVQIDELFLTACQSTFGAVCLLDLKFDLKEALIILLLFLLQFFIPPIRIQVSLAYLVLSAIELGATYRNVTISSSVKRAFRKVVI